MKRTMAADERPITQLSEEKLTSTVQMVLDYQAGDDEALNEIFRRYYPRVLAIVRVRMGGRLRRQMESMDLVQYTFFQAQKDLKKARIHGPGALINWLAVVAENVIRGQADYVSAQKRDPGLLVELDKLRAAVSSSEFRIEPAGEETTPLDALVRDEQREELLECLQELPDEYREVILLRRFAGASLTYVAEVMDRQTVQAVSMLCGRAEARLASILRKRRTQPDVD